ncbi:hypothetical protein AVEN_227324-1 [Araneus ventricosus]|uniref:Reverse transcriptase domain-containing protein n=1 Tax=Araneus ventricosus TaxID=182803 RepID=A0A4Y2GST3_ARAVE|nr:hypothetical protein AVEN_227324-1 [Araneus ventricosus]
MGASGSEKDFAQRILQSLYPHTADIPSPSSTSHLNTPGPDHHFTKREIKKAVMALPKGKAPGYDGLDSIILQNIFLASPELVCTIFNKCLDLRLFPTCYKVGVILLFHKDGKAMDDPKSYRPISLLP